MCASTFLPNSSSASISCRDAQSRGLERQIDDPATGLFAGLLRLGSQRRGGAGNPFGMILTGAVGAIGAIGRNLTAASEVEIPAALVTGAAA